MSTLLYRFDDADVFPLLETETTARGPVQIRVDGCGPDAFVRIAVHRHDDDPAETIAVIALPLIAVDGKPEKLLLDVLGDASGCRVFVEAGDTEGWGFAYRFGNVDFAGWRTCSADAQQPDEFWGPREKTDRSAVIPPVQLYRLGIAMNERCQGFDIGVKALSVTGHVRLAPPGIASSVDPSS